MYQVAGALLFMICGLASCLQARAASTKQNKPTITGKQPPHLRSPEQQPYHHITKVAFSSKKSQKTCQKGSKRTSPVLAKRQKPPPKAPLWIPSKGAFQLLPEGRSGISISPLLSPPEVLNERRIDQLQPTLWGTWLRDLGGVQLIQTHPAIWGWRLRSARHSQLALRIEGVPIIGALQDQSPIKQLLTIDPRIIREVSVWRGPASSVFGNHAYGGALHLRLFSPALATKGVRFHGRLRGGYQSASQAPSGHLTLSIAGHSGGLTLAGGAASHGLTQLGGGRNPIGQSDNQRAFAAAKAQWRWGALLVEGLYLFGQLNDIKRIDLFLPQGDVFFFRERRHMALLSISQSLPAARTQWSIRTAYQYLESYELVQEIALGTRQLDASRIQLLPRHHFGVYAQGETHIGAHLTLQYGVEWTGEWMNKELLQESGIGSKLPTSAPQQASRQTLLGRAHLQLQLLRGAISWQVIAGGSFQPHWDRLTLTPAPTHLPANQGDLTSALLPYALHLGTHLYGGRLWSLRLDYTSGFRVPSWRELGASGPQGEFYLRQAPLRPETLQALELRFDLHLSDRLALTGRFYGQLSEGTIIQQSATLPGGETLVEGVPVRRLSQEEGWRPSIGADVTAWVRIWRGWSAKASLHWMLPLHTDTPSLVMETWPLISPLQAHFASRFDFGRWGGIEIDLQLANTQQSSTAPQAVRLFFNDRAPTYPLWTRLTVRGTLHITRYLTLVANLSNLLNQPILEYGSIVYRPGINYQFQLVLQY